MNFVYYHVDCPTCKNKGLIMVEQAEAKNKVPIDKRYIWVLPDVWGEEAKRLGGEIPFLYNIDTQAILHVDVDDEDMMTKIENFIGTSDSPELV